MGVVQTTRYCSACGKNTLHVKHNFGTGWVCLLTLLTSGLFLLIWIPIIIVQAMKPLRCQACGKGRL